MSEYSGLTWNERILRCCELAERARLNAERAETLHARERYLTIADQWAGLAADIEWRQRDVRGEPSKRRFDRGSSSTTVGHARTGASSLASGTMMRVMMLRMDRTLRSAS